MNRFRSSRHVNTNAQDLEAPAFIDLDPVALNPSPRKRFRADGALDDNNNAEKLEARLQQSTQAYVDFQTSRAAKLEDENAKLRAMLHRNRLTDRPRSSNGPEFGSRPNDVGTGDEVARLRAEIKQLKSQKKVLRDGALKKEGAAVNEATKGLRKVFADTKYQNLSTVEAQVKSALEDQQKWRQYAVRQRRAMTILKSDLERHNVFVQSKSNYAIHRVRTEFGNLHNEFSDAFLAQKKDMLASGLSMNDWRRFDNEANGVPEEEDNDEDDDPFIKVEPGIIETIEN